MENLFSADALIDSFLTIQKQDNTGEMEYDIKTGKRNPVAMEKNIRRLGGQRGAMFYSAARSYMAQVGAGPNRIYRFVDKGKSTFAVYREIISFSYQNGINLKLFISPQHLILLEAIKKMNYWDIFEGWKKALALIAKEEAKRYSKETFPVWDFASANEFSAEKLPQKNIKKAAMQYYLDSYHYTPKIGGVVLNILYGSTEKNVPSVRNLSTLSESGPDVELSFNEYFAEVREKMELYKKEHLSEYDELDRYIRYYVGEKIQ